MLGISIKYNSGKVIYGSSLNSITASTINNIIFMDNLDSKLSFVTGSVTIGGTSVTTSNPTISGISISSIGGGSSTTVAF